jgi:NADPH-dependent ferric siderophore reductase
MNKNKDTFNDRMVKRTVLPAIYLWLLAAGSVVAMGILKPDVVLNNLDGFIALIAIIGGTAAPALSTVLRMWESEQTIEIDNMGVEMEHERVRDALKKQHLIDLEKIQQKHEHALSTASQEHKHIVEKHKETIVKLTPIHKMGEDNEE